MHAIDLEESSIRARCSLPQTKSRTALSCSPEIRQEWRGKLASASIEAYGGGGEKVSPPRKKFYEKSSGHGRHANAALHNCHDSPIFEAVEDQSGA
ncbi:hypothetical protein [Mesorhizobium comanense]|uniref:hypothetical protein n=1 Tax=Mesorhizobium comanense TaxID=2502215 RepID=UPI0010F90B1E|nr:hypothetical protein [Mesorhizobium comanense]